ncbi:MAG: hypothetical protein WD336_03045, partial [Trueperaceae bacterium]
PDFAATYRAHADPTGPRTDDPDAWATAARAAIAHAFYRLEPDEPADPWLQRALEATDRALALDADHVPALLLRAQALGERGLTAGFPDLNFPKRLRTMLEHAYALAPDDPDAQVALGLYHLELTRRGMGWAFQARADRGHELTRRGLDAAPPGRLDLRLMVGRMHLDRGETELGLELLREVERTEGRPEQLDAFQREVLAEVRELLDAYAEP